eukprot:2424296-Alexandrium_andersonii.AAC.1
MVWQQVLNTACLLQRIEEEVCRFWIVLTGRAWGRGVGGRKSARRGRDATVWPQRPFAKLCGGEGQSEGRRLEP